MRFEILIAENLTGVSPNIYLDTFDEESISLNFNIADITDISKKNSSYSKTISLPDTERNRRAFSDIFNIEAYDPVWDNSRPFNPNKKVACLVLGDTLEIFRGNLQLTNIRYDYLNNRHIYEVVIYSDNDTLFKIIGEQYLSDLDLSRYDHSFNRINIEKSWGLNGGNGDYTDGYFYPLIDYGFPLYYPAQNDTNYPLTFDKLYTGIYVKTIFDQIFTEAGFSYTSNFLNDYRFTSLIVPFSNKVFSTDTGLVYGFDNIILSASKTATSSIAYSSSGGGYYIIYYNSLNIDTINYDPNGLYSTSSYYYVNSTTNTSKQKFTINFKLRSTNYKPNTIWVDDMDDIRIWVKRSTKSDGSVNPSWSNTPTYNQIYNPSDSNYFRDVLINGGQGISIRNVIGPSGNLSLTQLPNAPGGFSNWLLEGTVTTDWLDNDPIQPNEEVRFFLTRTHAIPLSGPAVVTAFEILPGSLIYSTIDPNAVVYGGSIIMSKILPTKVKQKDFLISLFKMFNLYIEPSKELENHFIIEPRDEYYSLYQIAKDWSDKLDLSKDISYEILSNLQKRTNLFTYKEDKDYYNTNYTTNTKQVFGQFRFELDNDFISDENKIEPIFSPTPVDALSPKDSSGFYLPIIANFNNGNYVKPDGMNIRILFRQLLTPSADKPFVVVDSTTNAQYSYPFYPYVGPTDDPLNPNYSLNFGSISPFYNGYVETPNNLFNTYYRNQISELNDEGSRLITANFDLNSYDINNFRFSDLIFFTINNMSAWYRVNKIMDYDPLTETSTKVQLIKAFNYTLPYGPTGSTPSVEFCSIKMERTISYQGIIDLVSTIGSYANSEYPILTFYNTYENVGYSYGPVSESIGITDIELWAQSSGPTGLSITFNQVDQTETLAWKIDVPCNTGPYTFIIGMGNVSGSLTNIQPIFDTPYFDCVCENLNRVAPYQEEGLRNVVSTNNTYVGVLNTSTSNRTSMPNVAMVGSNNVIDSVGVVTIGDSNSGIGQNSLLVGKSNQVTGRQSLAVGDTNIVNGKNTLTLGSTNLVNNPQSLVVGYGNQLFVQQPESYTYSTPFTSSVFGTYSVPGTQSTFVVGNENQSLSTTGFVYGSNNLLGTSASNSFIIGNNNDLGFSNSGPSGSELQNIILFGSNITIDATTYALTQSFNNAFIIGNNITITQSISDTTYLYTENIILSENGGFNPPFIISDGTSTTQNPSGQSIIKTITGYYDLSLTAGNFTIVLNDYVDADILTDQTPIIVEANVRLESTTPGPIYECGVVTLFGVYTKNVGTYELVGTVDKVEKNNFSVLDKTADLTDTGGDMNLYLESTGTDLCNFYWDITFRYRYE